MSTGKKRGFFSDAADKLLKPRSIHDFNQTSLKTDNQTSLKTDNQTSLEDGKNIHHKPDKSGSRQPDKGSSENFENPILVERENQLSREGKVPFEVGIMEFQKENLSKKVSKKEVKSVEKIKWEFRISTDLAEAVTRYLYKKSDINNRLYRQDLIVQALEDFLEKEGFWNKKP